MQVVERRLHKAWIGVQRVSHQELHAVIGGHAVRSPDVIRRGQADAVWVAAGALVAGAAPPAASLGGRPPPPSPPPRPGGGQPPAAPPPPPPAGGLFFFFQ